MQHKFLKIAKIKSEKEFYKKYPTEESFRKAFPKAIEGLTIKPLPLHPIQPLNVSAPEAKDIGMGAKRDPYPKPVRKSWNPFAKDNAWNTGEGIATTDIAAGSLAIGAGALPFQPVKKNINPLQEGSNLNNTGTGSFASYKAGGNIPLGPGGLQVEGNQFEYLSDDTIKLVGPSHENGGIKMAYAGNAIEAEGNETFHLDNMQSSANFNPMAVDGTSIKGDGIIGGNLHIPGTRTKFKEGFVENAKFEKKNDKRKEKATFFLNEFGSDKGGPKNKYSAPAFNYGKVMSDAYQQHRYGDKNGVVTGTEEVKDYLTNTQNSLLEIGKQIDPKKGAEKLSNMLKEKAKWGRNLSFLKPDSLPAFDKQDPESTNLTEEQKQASIQEYSPAAPPPPPSPSPLAPPPAAPEHIKGMRNKFRPIDYLGEYKGMFEQAEPYQSQQMQPFLESSSSISLQGQKNTIQQAFAAGLKGARSQAEKAALTAQMSEQLAAVDAQEFQVNQQRTEGVNARNMQEIRGVRDTNLKLSMDALEKTKGAQEIARETKYAASRSISSKEAARRAKNSELGTYEQYAGWAFNPATKKKWEMLHPGETFEPLTVSMTDFENPEKGTSKKKKSAGDTRYFETKRKKKKAH